jgi:hypothetical protein
MAQNEINKTVNEYNDPYRYPNDQYVKFNIFKTLSYREQV